MSRHINSGLVISSTVLSFAAILSSGSEFEFGYQEPNGPRDQIEDDDDTCPPEHCGHNGVRLAESFFGALRLDGGPNHRSYAIVDFLDESGRSYKLDVRDRAFVGLEHETGALLLEDGKLAGSTIVVASSDGAEWALKIDSVDQLASWSRVPRSIPGYTMRAERWNLSDTRQGDPGRDTAWSMCPDGGRVVLFAGHETYDPATLDVEIHRGERNLTMACTDDLLGKVVRMGLDVEQPGEATPSTRTTRQSALRMLRADYCGTGVTFTVPGTRLAWQDQSRWMTHGWPESAAAAEAAWDEHGVICLNEPRLSDRYSRSDVVDACGRDIPRCDDEMLAAAAWVSFLP